MRAQPRCAGAAASIQRRCAARAFTDMLTPQPVPAGKPREIGSNSAISKLARNLVYGTSCRASAALRSADDANAGAGRGRAGTRAAANGPTALVSAGFATLPVAELSRGPRRPDRNRARGPRHRRPPRRLQRPAPGGHRPGRASRARPAWWSGRAIRRSSPSPIISAPATWSSRSPPIGSPSILAELVATPRPQRRWPRKRPAHEVPTFVSGIEARIVDVSYGGAGIEVYGDELPAEALQLTVPGTGMAVPVERVWARRTAKAQPIGLRAGAAPRQRRRRPVALVRRRPGAAARFARVAGGRGLGRAFLAPGTAAIPDCLRGDELTSAAESPRIQTM